MNWFKSHPIWTIVIVLVLIAGTILFFKWNDIFGAYKESVEHKADATAKAEEHANIVAEQRGELMGRQQVAEALNNSLNECLKTICGIAEDRDADFGALSAQLGMALDSAISLSEIYKLTSTGDQARGAHQQLAASPTAAIPTPGAPSTSVNPAVVTGFQAEFQSFHTEAMALRYQGGQGDVVRFKFMADRCILALVRAVNVYCCWKDTVRYPEAPKRELLFFIGFASSAAYNLNVGLTEMINNLR